MDKNNILAKILVWILIAASIFGVFTYLIYAIM